MAAPKFIIKNASNSAVEVSAYWRQHEKAQGKISVGSELEFEVYDEAAMTFKAIYPSVLVLVSSPEVYFTSGTVTRGIVTNTSVDITTEL